MASAVEVIVIEDCDAGKAGQLKRVRPGFARNYLLPRGLAVVADAHQMRTYETNKAELERVAQEKKDKSEHNKAKLGETPSVIIEAVAGTSGKLFGAITKERIAEAIYSEFHIEVLKENIKIKFPIKALGDFQVQLDLGSGTTADLLVKVTAQK